MSNLELCKLPPEGWFCTRKPDHGGPCAAHPYYNWKRPKNRYRPLALWLAIGWLLLGLLVEYQGHVIAVQREVIRETVPEMSGPFTCSGPDIKEF